MTVTAERKGFYVCLVLAAAVLAVYYPVMGFDFVNLDDQLYVYENPHVRAGITPEGIQWAFTNLEANFWHPLTWLSHMLDWQLFGAWAGGHHAMGLLLHVANTLILFMALARLTRRFWESAAVAALFALHPLHVESVAWVSERKDVLSTLFFMLTLLAYPRYVEQRTRGRYLGVLAPYALGLMAKPMLVTVPFVLMLLDIWPLRRFGSGGLRWDAARTVILEKIPFVVLAVPVGIMAVVAQDRGAALATMELVPLDMRLSNAAVSAVAYLWKTLWPVDLAVYYPLQPVPAGMAIGASLVLAALTAVALPAIRRYPYVTIGWLWYLGMLVPVSGLVQVGSHAMADRYTYIPLVGIFIALAWGMKGIIEKRPDLKTCGVVLSVVALSGLAFASGSQVETWRDSVTLFEHALAVTNANPVAHNNLGAAYDASEGSCEKARLHFLKAVELRNGYADAYTNLGVCAFREGDHEGAIRYFRRAVEADPRCVRGRISLGLMMMKKEKMDAAEDEFRQVLRIDPFQEAAHANLAAIMMNQGRLEPAESHLRESLRINPSNADAHNNIGVVLLKEGKKGDALSHFRQALAIAPGHPFAERNLQKIVTDGAD